MARPRLLDNEVNFARIASEIGALRIRVEKPGELAPAWERPWRGTMG